MATYHVSLRDLGKRFIQLNQDRHLRVVRAVQVVARTVGIRLIQEEIDATTPVPVDRGTYRRSWATADLPDGVQLYNPTIQASIIEKGRRPGARRPPAQAIINWVKRKGIAQGDAAARGIAFAIAKKIGERGIPAKHVLERAMRRLLPDLRKAAAEAARL